jgi:hypothetical protein
MEMMLLKDFDCGEIGGFGADISVVEDLVSTDGEMDAAGIGFFGTKGSDDAEVRGFLSFRDGREGDEEHGFRA